MEALGGSGSRMSSTQREELMDQVKQQIVIANTQELLTKMGEKCFSKCISKPGSSLDSSEQASEADSIPLRFFKEFADELAPVLCRLFQLVLETEVLPCPWKRTLVQPVPKKEMFGNVYG